MGDEGEINDLLEVTNVKGRVTKKNANMHVVILGDLDLKKRISSCLFVCCLVCLFVCCFEVRRKI